MIKCEEQYIVSNESKLTFYISPWDTGVFDFKVLNIASLQLDRDKIKDLEVIIEQLESFCLIEGIKVVVWKEDATDERILNLLQSYGYKYIEMSVIPYINPQSIEKDKFKKLCQNPVRKAESDDIEVLKSIARKSFQNDRFHKDANFPNDKADERYARWVENSFKDGEDIFVILDNNTIAGFFILKILKEKKYGEMKLGCIAPEYQGKKLGYNINAEIILKLREEGITLLDSPISISNLGIFNLYVSMGFKFKDQRVCFHKWIQS